MRRKQKKLLNIFTFKVALISIFPSQKQEQGGDRKIDRQLISQAYYLMDNCHFALGHKIFRQMNRIPMGSDPK